MKKRFLKTSNRSINLSGPVVMGILNITPDSFYDGGLYLDPDDALKRVLEMVKQGAGIVDVGGQSSRPGSLPVSMQDEIDRTLPIIELIAKEVDIPISIDTYRSEVAEKACSAGAHIINDISAGSLDSRMFDVAAKYGSGLILMHMRGTPENMQKMTDYADIVSELDDYFCKKIDIAKQAGVLTESIVVDPGIGFGKTAEQNLELLRHLDRFAGLGTAVLLGASRKSFIGLVAGADADNRLGGSIAAAIHAVSKGARIVRCHDVAETVQALKITDAINSERAVDNVPA